MTLHRVPASAAEAALAGPDSVLADLLERLLAELSALEMSVAAAVDSSPAAATPPTGDNAQAAGTLAATAGNERIRPA
jgi:hypothetical protein